MKIGLISDTHDNHPLIDDAIRLFSSLEVGLVLHAGDITTPTSLSRFSALSCTMIGVLGNCDRRQTLLKKIGERSRDISIQGRFVDITIDSLRIGMVHGDDPLSLIELGEAEIFDVVVSGHTHRPLIRELKETLFINPGEACGERYGDPTVAIFDTETKVAEILNLGRCHIT